MVIPGGPGYQDGAPVSRRERRSSYEQERQRAKAILFAGNLAKQLEPLSEHDADETAAVRTRPRI